MKNQIVNSQSDRIVTIVLQVAMFAYLLYALTACSIQMEIGYHGKTGRDDQKVTESFKGVKTERY